MPPHGSAPVRSSARVPRRLARRALLLVGALLAGACGGGSGGGGQVEPVGSLVAKPDGSGFFLADPHLTGRATRLHLVEITWGRLVDVHTIDEQGVMVPDPVFRDFVVNENIQSDQVYSLEENPITLRSRLVIRRRLDEHSPGDDFHSLLLAAQEGFPVVLPRGDGPDDPGPFSFVARNACLALRFDDLLEDGPAARTALSQVVRVLSGYPPDRPLEPRIVFDQNHGGVAGGAFHSTRVLIDLTVSEAEAADSPRPIPIQPLGLPASERDNSRANGAIRVPTRVDFGAGQFELLTGLSGGPVSWQENGPVDLDGPTREVVRALRAGNGGDQNNGFLLDLNPPRVLGSWPIQVERAVAVGALADHLIDLRFITVCAAAPVEGDIVSAGDFLLEVQETASAPGQDGLVRDVHARVLNEALPSDADELLGVGLLRSVYSPGRPVRDGCWVTFTPPPTLFPDTDLPSFAETTVRFSEPMDPASVKPFDSFMHVRGGQQAPVASDTLVVGEIRRSLDLKEFTFTPTLLYAHDLASRSFYHVRIPSTGGVTDLAGNELRSELPPIEFSIDPGSAPSNASGIVLRFSSTDEVEPFGSFDMRGQFLYELSRGVLRARPPAVLTGPVNRSTPVPSIMIPFRPGVQSPLSPLGSKVQEVWRYADVGWSIDDETKYNVDVVGISWSPVGGQVTRDFFPEFEMRLAHSRFLPDEQRNQFGLSKYPTTGLLPAPFPFADNILDDPRSPQKVVHPRSAGYRVDPVEVFLGAGGNPLMPFPMNRGGGPIVSYTWRDTAILAKGGPHGAGVPLDIEVGVPLFLEATTGSFAGPSQVPSVGLPLLWEVRCYPSNMAIGMNPLDINIALNTTPQPNFRAFSTGGFGISGVIITKDPDDELVPSGGFNPGSSPPGKPTRQTADNTLYLGQLDLLIRISRGCSIWLDTRNTSPRFAPAVIEPVIADLPPRTELIVEYRGADGFDDADDRPFRAETLDTYGDLLDGTILFHGGDKTWKSSATELDGARYFQFRVTFVCDIVAGLVPEISAVGVAFEAAD